MVGQMSVKGILGHGRYRSEAGDKDNVGCWMLDVGCWMLDEEIGGIGII